MASCRRLKPVSEFFYRHILKTGTCWLWTGRIYPNGYGQFHARTKVVYAHRWSYEFHVGPIPQGKELDHICRVRHCVRPGHLEAVTHRENVRRGNAVKNHCIHGHAYNKQNMWLDKHGWKHCRACNRIRKRNYYQEAIRNVAD